MKNNINHLLDENINYNDASPEDVYSISTSESTSSNLLYNSDDDSMAFDGFDNDDVYIIKNDATTDDILLLNEDDYIDYLFDDSSDVYIIESTPNNSDNDVIMLDSTNDESFVNEHYGSHEEIILDNAPIIIDSEQDANIIIDDSHSYDNEENIIDEIASFNEQNEYDIDYQNDILGDDDFDII